MVIVILLGLVGTSWEALRATRAESKQGRLRADAEMTLSASDFLRGVRFIAEGKRDDALPFLARSLSGHPTNGHPTNFTQALAAFFSPSYTGHPINSAALTRLTTLLTYHSWMLPRLILEHGSPVTSEQFSPDGKRIITASSDNAARVWDARSGQPLTKLLKQGGSVYSAQFSPDGKSIVTTSWDNTHRQWVAVWDVAPTQANYPDWLLQLGEAISGRVLNKQGVLEPTRLNRVETLNQLRQKLNQEPGDDDWVVWGRWFLADRATRTISPFSKITVPQYIENRIREKTAPSLDEAEQLAVGNPEVLQRISEARKTLDPTNPAPKEPAQ